MMRSDSVARGGLTTGIAAAFLLTGGSASRADLLYNNGPILTAVGVGPGGGDISESSEEYNTNGYSVTSPTRLADDFVVTGSGWLVQSVTVSGYVLGSYNVNTPTNPLTGLTLSLWLGEPEVGGSALIATSNAVIRNTFSGVWRVPNGQPENAQRPVFDITAGFANVQLAPGTYWIDYALNATGNVFSPLVMDTVDDVPVVHDGNAKRKLTPDGNWVNIFGGTGPQFPDLPFNVTGAVVPEPTSASFLLLASAAIVSRRRRQ